MKMTTEQFLSHLGIEIGKPFIVTYKNGLSRKTRLNEWLEIYYELPNGKWETQDENLSSILDCEITPLPKYTLTDDEKAIVRNIKDCYKWIVRDKVYGLFLCSNKPLKICEQSIDWDNNCGDYRYIEVFDNVFNFVQWENVEPVSLDELRKCL